MHTLALSPHLDDAIFSAAAQLESQRQRGHGAVVLTLFAGLPERIPPLAKDLHELWQLDDDAVQVRRREDLAACRELEAKAVHWDFPDALYREDLPENPQIATTWLFRMIAQPRLIEECASKLAEYASGRDFEQVLVPLGIGGHVDHRITRAAAERTFPARQRLYYEDYPYRRRHRKRWRALWPPGQWRSAHLPVSEQLLAAKCRAASCYRSQLRALAPAAEIDRKLERDFSRLERFWRVRYPERSRF